MTQDTMIAVRDPDGFRPLCLGKLKNGDNGGWIVASETCALDLIEAEYIRDIEPGEILIFKDGDNDLDLSLAETEQSFLYLRAGLLCSARFGNFRH